MRRAFRLTGISPERVLQRLGALRIPVFDCRKIDKTTLQFSVQKKDEERLLALYPLRGRGARGAYQLQKLPPRGVEKGLSFLQKRMGLVLGGLLFLAVTAWGDTLVLRVEIDAPAVYTARVQAALEEQGVKKYLPYQKSKEDLICASLLALDGVSYCSIKKQGSVLLVTLKTNDFFLPIAGGELYAERAGTLVRLVVLQGAPCAQVGDEIEAGCRLVEGAIYTAEGERMPSPVCAFAEIACTYQGVFACADEEEAFAKAYLAAGLESKQAKLQEKQVEKQGERYAVSLSYTWTQRLRY